MVTDTPGAKVTFPLLLSPTPIVLFVAMATQVDNFLALRGHLQGGDLMVELGWLVLPHMH